jgi:hypothetical protein
MRIENERDCLLISRVERVGIWMGEEERGIEKKKKKKRSWKRIESRIFDA